MEIILYIIGGLVVFSAIRGWMGAGVPMLRSQAEVARGAGTWKLGDTTYHLTGALSHPWPRAAVGVCRARWGVEWWLGSGRRQPRHHPPGGEAVLQGADW
jgi:hypothetical protein